MRLLQLFHRQLLLAAGVALSVETRSLWVQSSTFLYVGPSFQVDLPSERSVSELIIARLGLIKSAHLLSNCIILNLLEMPLTRLQSWDALLSQALPFLTQILIFRAGKFSRLI